jgi:hypothetical protein
MTRSITLFNRTSPAKPTEVFETYWRFAVERQNIFFKRLKTEDSGAWTADPIFGKYKFTNAYRASDRVSQYLIRNVIYEGDQSPVELFFRIMLFKFFNRIETWELLKRTLTDVKYSEYSFKRYDKILTKARSQGEKIYSAAYIMPSGSSSFGFQYKHRNHLKLLELMMDDELSLQMKDTKSMKQAFELLRSYPTIGDFLAYQYVTDLNYSTLLNFTEMEFVVPGPGSLNGLRKCFSSFGGYTEANLIRLVTEQQEELLAKYKLSFKSLWGRPLQLIDCQNLFCEVDKYSRVAHPSIKGNSERVRIKQNYRQNPKPINYWYPPKWQINEKIA